MAQGPSRILAAFPAAAEESCVTRFSCVSGLGYLSDVNALHIQILLGFMALARIRRPEGLRHVPPR